MTEKKNSNFQDSENDIVLDRSETFIATDIVEETVDNDESSNITSEKSDEYIENLMDAELAQAEAEAEEELKKEAKRKKDKVKAREKDKRALEEARKKHEQDMADENERLIVQERASSDSVHRALVDDNTRPITDSQIDFKSSESVQFENTFKEGPAYISNPDVNDGKEIKEFSEQVNYDLPQTSPRDELSSYSYPSATPTNDAVPPTEIKDNISNNVQGSHNGEHTQNPVVSEFPDVYSERKHKERLDTLYDERQEQQKLEREQNEAFFERVQQNTYEKQRASEQYQSFGSEGIDYSGNNDHSAYVRVGEETVIAEPVYQSIREDYEKSKAKFKSYGSHVPEAVMEQYRQASELYFSTERRIHEGSLLVKPETEAPLHARKPEQFDSAPDYNNQADSNFIKSKTTSYSPEPQNFHNNEDNTMPSTHIPGFNSSYQNMARRAHEVMIHAKMDETSEQSKGSFPHVSTGERVNNNVGSGAYFISQERYESLKTKYKASVDEIASYEGKNIPASVLRRSEQINKVYSAIKEKVDNGSVNIVSEGGVSPTSHSGRHINNGDNIKQSPNRNPNVVLGSQVISETNKHNYSAKSERTGDGHRKPPKTPFQASPLSKYDKLKIYHSRNYLAPFERGTRRAVGALGSAVAYAARSEQTGTANTMVSAQQRARDAVNTLKVLKDTPRNIQAAYYATKDAALTARNVVRFFEGKEAIAHKSHKPLTKRQIDKAMENPFAGAEKNKIDKKFGANVNLKDSKINSKITLKTAQARALKKEIKDLQGKGSALSADERKHLKALMDKKKVLDTDLRNIHGFKKARAEASRRNREADRTYGKSTEKTIKKNKGRKLSKKDKAVLAHLQERKGLQKKRDKIQKAKNARKQLTTSLSAIITRAASESEDSAIQSIMNADRVLQNRYVRSILRFSKKAILLPTVPFQALAGVGVQTLDNKLGISKGVKSGVKAAKGAVINSRVYKEINGGMYNRAKKQIVKHTPEKIKTRVKKVNRTVSDLNDKRKAVLNKFKALKDRLAKSRIGRAVSSVGKGVGNVFSAFSFVKKTLYKIGLYCASFLIIIAMVGAAISSAGSAVSSLVMSDETVDGKIDVSKYVRMFNKSEQGFLAKIDRIASEASSKYDNVTVSYQSGTLVNNFKEILSMAAVYLEQDFSTDLTVEEYISQLYDDSHYYTTVESNPYYCSGCIYHFVGNKWELYCPGNHVDLDINVMVLGFDEMFFADSSINASINGTGSSTGNVTKGDELGTFTITYYCTEKYPHICNGGPPYKTATGTVPTPGRTIAVDKNVIPLGTHVIINGHEYIAEDTGGAINGNRIDIAVASHGEALQLGTKTYKVYAATKIGTSNGTGGSNNSTVFRWDEQNIDWAKNVYENINSETYAGLDDLNKFSGGNVSYEGVVFEQGETKVVYYNQYDIRWKNLPYSTSTIGESGCGPTSMAMIVSTLTGQSVDPIQMCNWAASRGYYVPGSGTSWSFISGAAAKWGLSCQNMGKGNAQAVVSALSQGKLVVMSTGPGQYYSGKGHFLVLRGVDEQGKILVADPASKPKSEKSWTLAQITSGLKNWWIIG